MKTLLARVEHILLAAGIALISTHLAIVLYGSASSHLALREFDRSQVHLKVDATSASTAPQDAGVVPADEEDFSLWDKKRIQAYRDSLRVLVAPPMAAMSIEKLHIRVPVFEGTGDVVLNRGAGWITGTARPGEPGNIGIAGHRDGFFRGLKDVAVGDRIALSASGRTQHYAVDAIRIVAPTDVHVLEPRARPSLTLVTCYPFYFIGNAPQRYIVHASLVETPDSLSTNLVPVEITSRTHRPQENRQ